MGKLLAAALLTGAVAAGASPVVPQGENELIAGVSPVTAERDNGIVAGANPVVQQRDDEVEVCTGAPVQPFERRLSEQVRRFTFDGAMLEPFLRLWQSGDRPGLPMPPESVTVYARPTAPMSSAMSAGVA
jgi:hypothetical protein